MGERRMERRNALQGSSSNAGQETLGKLRKSNFQEVLILVGESDEIRHVQT